LGVRVRVRDRVRVRVMVRFGGRVACGHQEVGVRIERVREYQAEGATRPA
jgi:hypothetical protein